MKYIKGAVSLDVMGLKIFDADNNHILDKRGWGWIQYLKDNKKSPEEIQHEIGVFIRDAINEKLERDDRQHFQYRGAIGSVEKSADDDCFHGKITNSNHLVTYEANSINELKKEFKLAVDDATMTMGKIID